MPDLAIIIVNYNTCDLLRACLTAVNAHLSTIDGSVVVVDNASSDGSAEMVRSEFPHVSLLANTENTGFAGANNTALAATDSEEVLLLNTDAFLHAGALHELRRVLHSDDRIAVAGPRMYDGSGAVLATSHGFETLGRLLAIALGLHELLPSSAARWAARFLGRTGELHRVNYEAGAPLDVDWLSGACMMVRRRAIADVGPMDDRYFMYMEDEDWCRRFRSAGYRVVYVPGAGATHLIRRPSRSSSRRAWVHRDSRLAYHKRYHPHLYRVFHLLSNLCAARQWGMRTAAALLDDGPGSETCIPAPRKAEL